MTVVDCYQEPEEFECDCEEEELDILTGRAVCWRCGASRFVTSDEFQMRMKLEAEAQAAWDQHCAEMEKSGAVLEPPPDSQPIFITDDEIPF